MSFLSSVAPSSRYENLGGGYLTQSSQGGDGFDSVGFVTAKKTTLPTSSLPGPDTPIPNTTQKPNRETNIPIVYARTSINYVQSGEIVFVDRYSDGGAPNVQSNPGMRGGSGTSMARVATIEQINAAVLKVMALPETRERMAGFGAEITTSTPDEFAAHIRSEMAKLGKVIRDANIKVN